jgi:Zn finger protein HypA/HybF involved in hydrogenase expression
MDEAVKELGNQVYCCIECGRHFEYRELRCYSRFCPNCGNFMMHIDDTEQTREREPMVIGGYF